MYKTKLQLWTRIETDWVHLVSWDLEYNRAPESIVVLTGSCDEKNLRDL